MNTQSICIIYVHFVEARYMLIDHIKAPQMSSECACITVHFCCRDESRVRVVPAKNFYVVSAVISACLKAEQRLSSVRGIS